MIDRVERALNLSHGYLRKGRLALEERGHKEEATHAAAL